MQSGLARADQPGAAVHAATLAALLDDQEPRLVVGALRRFVDDGIVAAAIVVDGDDVHRMGALPQAPRLVALARLAPSNNQLAVSSVSAQYRVADLGAVQLAVQAAQDVAATVTLDSWLEALSAARLQSH